VLERNRAVNVFHRGFVACDRYRGAEDAIERVRCPVLFLLGRLDQMTPPKAAQGLIDRARAAGKTPHTVLLDVGHNQMTEAPDATLFAIRDFLQS
jgi:pimeloyl-ACP methyl ester carboxylesterase